MRRKDREITDQAVIKKIFYDCHCCRLGFNDKGSVYIVPLNFGYEEIEDKHILYFHSASEGRKIDLIKTTGYVGFELDTNFQLNTGKTACEYSAKFQSIIGTGNVSIIENRDQKIHALCCIMQHYTDKNSWDFSPAMIDQTTVFKLDVAELSCKEHT